MGAVLGLGEAKRPLGAASWPADARRWGLMPKPEPDVRLTVVIRIVLDWRFLLAVAVLVRTLLNR